MSARGPLGAGAGASAALPGVLELALEECVRPDFLRLSCQKTDGRRTHFRACVRM